jgi:hypothetical protein
MHFQQFNFAEGDSTIEQFFYLADQPLAQICNPSIINPNLSVLQFTSLWASLKII